MRQNMTMLRIDDQDLGGPSRFLVNGIECKIDAQEENLVVRYLNKGIATTLLDAI